MSLIQLQAARDEFKSPQVNIRNVWKLKNEKPELTKEIEQILIPHLIKATPQLKDADEGEADGKDEEKDRERKKLADFKNRLRKNLLNISPSGNMLGLVLLTNLETIINETPLFEVLIKDTTGEIKPTDITSKKYELVMSMEVRLAWYKTIIETVLGKDDVDINKYAKAIPMLGVVTPQQLVELTKAFARAITIPYPGLAKEKTVHDLESTPYSTMCHDLDFHFKILLMLVAFAKPLHELEVYMADTIAQVTSHPLTPLSWSLLDFADSMFVYYSPNKFYHWRYDDDDQLQYVKTLIGIGETEKAYANLEYAFIIMWDMVKNQNNYINHFERLSNHQKKSFKNGYVDLFNVLEFYITFVNIHRRKVSTFTFVREEVGKKPYSNSLGVFWLLLQLYSDAILTADDCNDAKQTPQQMIDKLCDDLHELEKRGVKCFSWYIKEGIKCDLDGKRFRFRLPESSADDDDRSNVKLKKSKDGAELYFSSDPDWFKTLRKAVDKALKSDLKQSAAPQIKLFSRPKPAARKKALPTFKPGDFRRNDKILLHCRARPIVINTPLCHPAKISFTVIEK